MNSEWGILALAGTIGVLSGAHTSIWGMYKDAIHEGFTVWRFSRSIIIGAIAAVLLQWIFRLPLPSVGAIALLFGLAYGTERAIVEIWKTFLREEDQSKYFIPMQFTIGGKPVNRATRLAVGAGYVLAIALGMTAIASLDGVDSGSLSLWRAGLVGLAAGLIVAIGGGWKDAPKEGFDLLKFFRSPIMTVIYALMLSRLTDSYLLIAAAALGYERATAETYKTFFFPSRPRGKFSGKPILHPGMLRRRQYFVPAYVAICAGALVCLGIAL
jgi:hypothetical protein